MVPANVLTACEFVGEIDEPLRVLVDELRCESKE